MDNGKMIMENGQLVPKLRFPEFEGDWEESKIEEHFEFKNGLNKGGDFFGHGLPIINFMDVYILNSIKKNDINGLVELTPSEIERYKVKKGDVFFTRTSETIIDIGMSATLVEDIENCVFSGFVLRARPKNKLLDPYFTSYCFQISHVRKEITTKSSMTTRALTSGTNLNKVIFRFPKEKKEQQKIANFLTAIDQRITLLKEKKAAIEDYKKGLMQKIFSQEILFTNDEGNDFPDWAEGNLNTLCEINPKSDDLPETFIYIDLESVKDGQLQLENSINKEKAPSRAQRLLEKGDILYQMVRPYQRNNLYFNKNGEYVASTGYAQLRAKHNAEFLYYLIHTESFVNSILRLCTGSNYPAINSSDLGTVKISYPCKKEQQKIADCLSAIDQSINQLTKQIDQTTQFKKGLLQRMFV